jgi:hypothetical protein
MLMNPIVQYFDMDMKCKKKRKSAVLTSAALTEEITVTLKSSNQKDVCALNTFKQCNKGANFQAQKISSLKYPKRGMSL